MKKAILLLLTIPILVNGCFVRKLPSTEISAKALFVSSSNTSYDYYVQATIEEKRENFELAALYLKKAIEADPESVFLGKELALILVEQGLYEQALSIAEDLIARHPKNVDVLILYGRINHILKKYDSAGNAYAAVLEIDPKQEDIYLLLGAILSEKDETEKALALYQQLVQQYPDSYAGYYLIGKIYKKQNKRAEARSSFERALELQPALVEARFELVELYKQSGKHDLVIQMYREIMVLSPMDIRSQLELALFYQEIGKAGEATKILYQLGKRSVEESTILRKIILLYIDTKKYDQAIFVLTGMLKGAPDNSDLQYVIGVANDERGDWQRAIKFFQKVKPETLFYDNGVVHIAFLTQEHIGLDEAIVYLESIVAQNKNNVEFLLYLGSLYEEKKMFAEAAEILNRGLSMEPENTKLRFRLGVVYDKWGKKDACIEEMKVVIRQDPKDHHALNYLGYTYVDLGVHLKEAESLIREALSQKPDDGYITDSLGWVFFKTGRYQEAVDTLERANELVRDDPVILEHLGDAYRKVGEPEKAVKTYRESLKYKKEEREALKEKIRGLENRKENQE